MGDEVARLEARIMELKRELVEARQRQPAEPVDAYQFESNEGSVRLSELFGSRDDLFVVHNMGHRCAYCTLWADGLVGLLPHIESRSALVVVSPDEPATQDRFARSRGWPFRMVSDPTGAFTRAMGYRTDDGVVVPGVSAFRKQMDGRVLRTGTAEFGPGDEFCAVWPLFDLLEGGVEAWQPRFEYPTG
jgi:predicted dithiol-disulfide oxidoreductase (DUF899 family)